MTSRGRGPYQVSRDWFWAVFYKDYYYKAFNPRFAYKAMAQAHNKTIDQVRAHEKVSGYIDNFNRIVAELIQEADEECSQQGYEELDRQVKEKVDTLAFLVFRAIYGEGGRGWPSPDRAKAILKWRKNSAPNKKGGHMDQIGKYYTIAEVSEIVRVSRRTLYAWSDTGKLKTVKIGRGLRVPQAELDRILAGSLVVDNKAQD